MPEVYRKVRPQRRPTTMGRDALPRILVFPATVRIRQRGDRISTIATSPLVAGATYVLSGAKHVWRTPVTTSLRVLADREWVAPKRY
jgi:hypothetical protein